MNTVPDAAIDYSAMTSEQMIVATLKIFCGDGITEIRCLDAHGRKKRIDSGYFDDFGKVSKLLRPYVLSKRTKGIYFVINEVPAELKARAANRLEEFATTTTADNAITSRRWLYVDLDPVRPSGISSTNEQVQQAIQLALEVTEWTRSQGLCEPILAMSGNGAHLHFPISLSNNADSLAIVSGVLRTLKEKFSDDVVNIDTTVSNAARICRLYGTFAHKGDNTADRPHRMARILSVPDYLRLKTGDVCDVDALRAVAAMSEPSTKAVSRPAMSAYQPSCPDRRLIVPEYLRSVGVTFREEAKGEFTNYVLAECPFNPDHKAPDSYVTQGSRGGISFKCSHNSCSHQNWQTLQAHWGKPKSEQWDPPYPERSAKPASMTIFLEGERVKCGDRGNFGTVVQDNGGATVSVHFKAKDGYECTKELSRAAVRNLDGVPGANPQPKELVFHDAWKAAFTPKPMRECIIEGMLRRGEVANFIASTKTGKSWFSLLLLFCVCLGRDWLKRRVARGNVLLIDNELHTETIENRLAAVRFALQIEPEADHSQFDYLACRGDWLLLQDLIEGIPLKYPPGALNLIVIDAKYRLFGNGLEENSNDDQTTFHNIIDKFAKEMNCPVVLVHHSTKGDQSGKAVTDLGSGGGSQSRAVDLHMTIRPHQQPGLAVLEGAVRSFAPIEPSTLRWSWPVWSVAIDVEPALPRNSKDTERVSEMRTRMLKHISTEWQSVSSLADRCSTQKGRPPFVTILDDLEREGNVEIWHEFIPKNTKKPTSGIKFSSNKMTSNTVGSPLSDVSG